MKTIKRIMNEKGLSLLETMVVSAVIGVIAVGVSRLTSNVRNRAKSVDVKLEEQSLVAHIRRYMIDEQSCTNTVTGKTSGSEITVTDNTGNPIYKAGDDVGRIHINSIKIVRTGAISSAHKALGEVQLAITKPKVRSSVNLSYTIPDVALTFDSSNVNITACYADTHNILGVFCNNQRGSYDTVRDECVWEDYPAASLYNTSIASTDYVIQAVRNFSPATLPYILKVGDTTTGSLTVSNISFNKTSGDVTVPTGTIYSNFFRSSLDGVANSYLSTGDSVVDGNMVVSGDINTPRFTAGTQYSSPHGTDYNINFSTAGLNVRNMLFLKAGRSPQVVVDGTLRSYTIKARATDGTLSNVVTKRFIDNNYFSSNALSDFDREAILRAMVQDSANTIGTDEILAYMRSSSDGNPPLYTSEYLCNTYNGVWTGATCTRDFVTFPMLSTEVTTRYIHQSWVKYPPNSGSAYARYDDDYQLGANLDPLAYSSTNQGTYFWVPDTIESYNRRFFVNVKVSIQRGRDPYVDGAVPSYMHVQLRDGSGTLMSYQTVRFSAWEPKGTSRVVHVNGIFEIPAGTKTRPLALVLEPGSELYRRHIDIEYREISRQNQY